MVGAYLPGFDLLWPCGWRMCPLPRLSLSALVCLLDLATPVHWDNCEFNYLIFILLLFPCNMKTIP